MGNMTRDTERALEKIKPIAHELGIKLSADDKFLYCDNTAIGICDNSTWATVYEFIGYTLVKYDLKFRQIGLTNSQIKKIQRYWFTPDQISKLRGDMD